MTDRQSDSPRNLARSMAEATGLDLSEAQRCGSLTADEVSDLFQSCRRCNSWQDCPTWMNENGLGAVQAPGFCRNRPFFDAVRRDQIGAARR